jgi:hypothetical protein
VVFGALAITLLVVGTSYLVRTHQGPVTAGVIYGCVQQNNGNLRIIAAEASSGNNETPLDWNAMGPPGVSGLETVSSTNPAAGMNGSLLSWQVTCPTGKRAIAGGAEIVLDPAGSTFLLGEAFITRDVPLANPPLQWFAAAADNPR